MSIKKFSCIYILLLFVHSLFAQVTLESSPVGTSTDGALVVYGSNNIEGNKRIPYDRIKGSPFWMNEYQMATIIDRNNQVLGKAPSKLNLYTNELYFLTPKGEERVASPGKVRKIFFYKGADTSGSIMAVFENNLPILTENNPNAENPSYVQVLNNGDIQLLKHVKMMLMTGDSLFGTMKRYYFSDQVSYFINNKFGQNIRIRKLNKDNVMETLNADGSAEAWVKHNAINFKKEEDIIRFLDYINSKKK